MHVIHVQTRLVGKQKQTPKCDSCITRLLLHAQEGEPETCVANPLSWNLVNSKG